jgi:F0F1-type ATP synthase epsilon subunit
MSAIQNLVSHELTAAEKQGATAAIGTLKTMMLFVNTIDPTSVSVKTSMDVANKAFVEDALAIVNSPSGADIVGNFVDATEFEKDINLWTDMDNLERDLQTLLSEVQRAKRAAGGDAFTMGLRVYDLVKLAQKSKVANADAAYQKLSARFAKVKKVKITK